VVVRRVGRDAPWVEDPRPRWIEVAIRHSRSGSSSPVPPFDDLTWETAVDVFVEGD